MSSRVTTFVSHVHEEKDLALTLKRWLIAVFGDVGVFVSSDTSSIDLGLEWLLKIKYALAESKIVLVLLTPQSISRSWIYFEAGGGYVHGAQVIPVCIRDLRASELPKPLGELQACEIKTLNDLQVLAEHLAKTLNVSPRMDLPLANEFLQLAESRRKRTTTRIGTYDPTRVFPMPPPEGVLDELPTYQDLVNRIVEEIISLRSKKRDEKLWIGLSGPRQSGKTTLASHIRSKLQELTGEIVSFAEDDFYLERSERNEWMEKGDPRFLDQKRWLRWEELNRWFRKFRDDIGKFRMDKLYDLSSGKVHRSRDVEIRKDSLFLYEGQFLEDTDRYPQEGFDFLVRLAINFDTSFRRSLEKDGKRGLSRHTIELNDTLVYRSALWLHTAQFRPHRKADIVVDTTEFERPTILRYDRLNM